jgi:alkylation response protein AidB-like acyl-CoA dehydrogenase
MQLEEFRAAVDQWLDEHAAELAPAYDGAERLDADMAQLAKVKRLVYDAGWGRYGWPELVGGYGGSTLLRGYLGEALANRDLVKPGFYSMHEFLAPALINFAPPELAADMVPRLIRGDEMWCQGFSEPGTGSNLAALTCKATRTDDGWRGNGQKVWTSLAQFSTRCLLLTRTGDAESAHRGITAMLVDLDTPGLTVRPFHTMHEVEEFSEVFFDDVLVPFDRTVGAEGQGWAVAMSLLPMERASSMWLRMAYLSTRFQRLLDRAPDGALDETEVGDVVTQLYGLRAVSRRTQHRLAAGQRLGPETSVDKVLLGSTEQAIFDLATDALADDILLGDEPLAEKWRSETLYSRAATIYGGTIEIQRNIIARQVLDLGPDH